MKLFGTYFYIFVARFHLVTLFVLRIRHVTPIPASESYGSLLGLPSHLRLVVYTLCYLSTHLFHHSFSILMPYLHTRSHAFNCVVEFKSLTWALCVTNLFTSSNFSHSCRFYSSVSSVFLCSCTALH